MDTMFCQSSDRLLFKLSLWLGISALAVCLAGCQGVAGERKNNQEQVPLLPLAPLFHTRIGCDFILIPATKTDLKVEQQGPSQKINLSPFYCARFRLTKGMFAYFIKETKYKYARDRFSDEFEGRVQSDELRLLTRPLHRFGKTETETLDGALFAHAHGTDPELLIIVEAIRIESAYRWHYALAPMTGYALKATLDDKPNWEVPWRKPPYDPKEPFFIRVHSREMSLRDLIPFKIPGR